MLDPDAAQAKAISIGRIIEELQYLAPESCRFESFYLPTQAAIAKLQEALKWLPKEKGH